MRSKMFAIVFFFFCMEKFFFKENQKFFCKNIRRKRSKNFLWPSQENLYREINHMHLHRINAILLRQLYLLRSTSRLLPIFAWVGIDIVLWGFLTRYLNSLSIGGLNFIPLLLGAILLWDFFIRVMHGVSMSFFEDVWSRNFLNIFASPLYISEYIIGLVLTSTLTSLIALITMIVSPFAGVLYPVSTLPMWMQHVSSLLPPSYVFEGIRTILQGNPLPSITLFLGIALALFYIFLASLFFSFTYRRAVRSGLLARYSAESVG